MAYIRSDTYKAINENNMDQVLFTDPFGDVARKSKRNLLVAGFICLLISVLNLEVSGFLGLKATNMNLGNDIAQGLAFLITLYLFVSFIFHAYIDYAAWNFQREKQQTKPFYNLVSLIENQVSITGEQIKKAVHKLDSLSHEENIQAKADVFREINAARQQLESINTSFSSLIEETNPLINSWRHTIEAMEKLSWRLKARFISLWILDIIFPLFIGFVALYKSYESLPILVVKITS